MAESIIQFDELMNPVLQALRELGGSGTNQEIYTKVYEIAKISAKHLEILHSPGKGGMTEIEYRLMWTRTYLKKFGLIENSTRGVWVLTPKGSSTASVDKREVVRVVREGLNKDKDKEISKDDEINHQVEWQEELMEALREMTPAGFERLIQRMLREAGFIHVEVTGRTGDGGIDGHGILRLGELISFNVIFQCKKWQNSVGAGAVRDFRGAMVGRADKGLLITTGTFTKDAVKEATRDGAPAIDLVDGDQLAEKLKQLSLGVTTKKIEIEQVSVDKEWFKTI